jgi:Bacterial regulatory proteins, gntR family
MRSAEDGEGFRKLTLRSRIAAVLIEEILANSQETDFLLASEHQLCDRFQTSRVTIRLVLGDLEHRGLIYRRHGRGTFAYGQENRGRADLVLVVSTELLKFPPLLDFVRGVQSVLNPLGSSLIVRNTLPRFRRSTTPTNVGGVVMIMDKANESSLLDLKHRLLPCFRVSEASFTAGNTDLERIGHRLAQRLVQKEQIGQLHHRKDLSEFEGRWVGLDEFLGETETPKATEIPVVPRTSRTSPEMADVLALVRRREAIQSQIAGIEKRMNDLIAEAAWTPTRATRRPVSSHKKPKGALIGAVVSGVFSKRGNPIVRSAEQERNL